VNGGIDVGSRDSKGTERRGVRQNQLESGQKSRVYLTTHARLCLALKIYIQNDVKLIEDNEPD
jgi:hypothetical protein